MTISNWLFWCYIIKKKKTKRLTGFNFPESECRQTFQLSVPFGGWWNI